LHFVAIRCITVATFLILILYIAWATKSIVSTIYRQLQDKTQTQVKQKSSRETAEKR